MPVHADVTQVSEECIWYFFLFVHTCLVKGKIKKKENNRKKKD
jgi:hypothetical protein